MRSLISFKEFTSRIILIILLAKFKRSEHARNNAPANTLTRCKAEKFIKIYELTAVIFNEARFRKEDSRVAAHTMIDGKLLGQVGFQCLPRGSERIVPPWCGVGHLSTYRTRRNFGNYKHISEININKTELS